jgi:hypothetical protein
MVDKDDKPRKRLSRFLDLHPKLPK